MKKLLDIILLLVLVAIASLPAMAQEEEKPELLVSLRYFADNNQLQYLEARTMLRANRAMQPAVNMPLSIYINEQSDENLVGKVVTNQKGKAILYIPASMKDHLASNETWNFIAVYSETPEQEEVTAEVEVTRARMTLDTLNEDETRQVVVKVESFEGGEWVPAADVEVKIGVRRQGGALQIGEDESYTTDEDGFVTGEFILQDLPAADKDNNIILVARLDDHDLFGNLSVEMAVPWGRYTALTSNFHKRSLWGTRDKTPIWLLFMAYSIIGGVWGVILYLVVQIFRIRKMGRRQEQTPPKAPPVRPQLAELEA